MGDLSVVVDIDLAEERLIEHAADRVVGSFVGRMAVARKLVGPCHVVRDGVKGQGDGLEPRLRVAEFQANSILFSLEEIERNGIRVV
ncbi:MAG: hypothetical protein M1337_01720 [Actinobacteria bacterium]|nr:hypothetical protein [Actinomycetota bacterium]